MIVLLTWMYLSIPNVSQMKIYSLHTLPEIEGIPRKFVYACNQIMSLLEYELSWQRVRETEVA